MNPCVLVYWSDMAREKCCDGQLNFWRVNVGDISRKDFATLQLSPQENDLQ